MLNGKIDEEKFLNAVKRAYPDADDSFIAEANKCIEKSKKIHYIKKFFWNNEMNRILEKKYCKLFSKCINYLFHVTKIIIISANQETDKCEVMSTVHTCIFQKFGRQTRDDHYMATTPNTLRLFKIS